MQQARAEDLAQVDEQQKEDMIKGLDMKREKYYWKLPTQPDPIEILADCRVALNAWGRRCRIHDVDLDTRRNAHLIRQQITKLTNTNTPTPAFKAYTAKLKGPEKDEALVLEDKDTSAVWRCNSLAYQVRTINLYEQDAVHWTRTTQTKEELEDENSVKEGSYIGGHGAENKSSVNAITENTISDVPNEPFQLEADHL